MTEPRGKLVVISGPSGAGKTTVCRALKEDPRVQFSVSATTRQMRPGERDGIDYVFLKQPDFIARRDRGEFLESAEYNGNFYGTLRAPMDEALAAGKVFILEIEVQGTRQLRDHDVQGDFIFIVPPSMEVLHQRLVDRQANTEEEIAQRMQIAAEEMKAAELYDHVIENAVVADTVAAVKTRIGL